MSFILELINEHTATEERTQINFLNSIYKRVGVLEDRIVACEMWLNSHQEVGSDIPLWFEWLEKDLVHLLSISSNTGLNPYGKGFSEKTTVRVAQILIHRKLVYLYGKFILTTIVGSSGSIGFNPIMTKAIAERFMWKFSLIKPTPDKYWDCQTGLVSVCKSFFNNEFNEPTVREEVLEKGRIANRYNERYYKLAEGKVKSTICYVKKKK